MSGSAFEALAQWAAGMDKDRFDALLVIVNTAVMQGQRIEREACAQMLTDYMARYNKPGYPINIRKLRDAMLARGWQGGEP